MRRRRSPAVLAIALLTLAWVLVGGAVGAWARTPADPTPTSPEPTSSASGSSGPTPQPSRTIPRTPKNQPPQVTVAIAALRARPPVYNSPRAALSLTDDQQAELKAAIAHSATPIFVAIIPKTGKPTGVAKSIYDGVQEPGTYVAVVGTSYDVYSTLFDAKPALTAAFAEERINGPTAVLVRFCSLLSAQASGSGSIPGTGQTPWFPLSVALVIIITGIGYFIVQVRTPPLTEGDPGADAEPPRRN